MVPRLAKVTLRTSAAVLFGLVLTGTGGSASAADFYEGKQIKMIVSTGPGGGYDTYARVVAEHLPNHIPGKPSILVQNMPGASGIKATNFIYNLAPRDGTVIITGHSSLPSAPLLNPKAVKFDVNKLSWIGSVTKDPFVGYVWHTAPIKTFEDAKKTVVTMGGNAVGAAGVDMAIISNVWFGTKFKLVTGYKNSTTVKLAMEREEVDGTFANAWASLKTSQPDWIEKKRVRIIVQHGFNKHPELQDVPLFIDQTKTKEQRQALELLLARQEFAKPFFAPPELPAGRLETLQTAFDAMIKDPKFHAGLEKVHLSSIDPLNGRELAAMVKGLASTPPSIIKTIEAILSDFKEGKR